jgi:hypothetical protein
MTIRRYDLAIIGGGTAGVCAAVQAARAGSRTLLVERSSRLGGTIVNSGIPAPGLFHAFGRQVIAGIGWDLVVAAMAEGGGKMPDFTDLSRGIHAHQPVIDPYLYAALCDEAVLGSGADLLLHTMLAGVTARDEGWTITLCGKEGLHKVTVAELIDCTGDASAVALAGAPVVKPAECQPATLCCHLSGYRLEDLDLPALDAAFAAAVARGELSAPDACWNAERPQVSPWLRKRGMNANHLEAGVEAATSPGRTALEIAGRRAIRRLTAWLRRQPGLADLRVDTVYPEVGVRETVRIAGEATVTIEDYVTGRIWPDALCHAYYCIDLHGLTSAGWDVRMLADGRVPTVPRGALIPRGSRHLLAAGRILSADRLAFSALRVQATCMATGQAAGALAALAVRGGTTPGEVDLARARDLLSTHGAIVPGK